MTVSPPFLKANSIIKIVAPARSFAREKVSFLEEEVRNIGFEVQLGSTIGTCYHQYSSTDRERFRDLQNALDNPDIHAIWCARGGYGTIRILDQLNFTKFMEFPKWIIGYSDITILHTKLQSIGIQSIHGALVLDYGQGSHQVRQRTLSCLQGKYPEYTYASSSYAIVGEARGTLWGGNLSILYSLLGTDTLPDLEETIVFIEDVDEYVYHIDRMMISLKRSGVLSKIKGLIVGAMTNIHDHETPFGMSYQESIIDAVKSYGIPVAFNFPSGHVADNNPLILGAEVALCVTKKKTTMRYVE